MSGPGVVTLSPDDPEQVEAAARLHEELLPTAMAARFGRRFMTRFYFTRLVASGLLVCDLFRWRGEYVGFSVYTPQPEGLLRLGMREHFLPLCWILLCELLSHPTKLRLLWDLAGRTRRLEGSEAAATGHWLGFGVRLEALRAASFGPGRRISTLLLEHMLEFFRARGFQWVESTVAPDNRPAILFYLASGFRVEDPARPGEDLTIRRAIPRPGGR